MGKYSWSLVVLSYTTIWVEETCCLVILQFFKTNYLLYVWRIFADKKEKSSTFVSILGVHVYLNNLKQHFRLWIPGQGPSAFSGTGCVTFRGRFFFSEIKRFPSVCYYRYSESGPVAQLDAFLIGTEIAGSTHRSGTILSCKPAIKTCTVYHSEYKFENKIFIC